MAGKGLGAGVVPSSNLYKPRPSSQCGKPFFPEMSVAILVTGWPRVPHTAQGKESNVCKHSWEVPPSYGAGGWTLAAPQGRFPPWPESNSPP